ncbi:riboflavin kinase [Leifsonia sp. 71-9]|uniref:riboflavin kinase n=1 Tax=Leifsonia sp. 71-9 TaxID=1895934 RepID=UPI0025B9E076|nr:riboflavin kinase [Leifsonia sp. 71-9]
MTSGFRGVVAAGDRRGRLLGFPTANLAITAGEPPADGVYSCWVTLDGETAPRGGTVSIGANPTFDDVSDRRVEVHIHDFGGDLYGRSVAVEIVRLLRENSRLGGVGELTRKSAEDVRRSRAILSRLLVA